MKKLTAKQRAEIYLKVAKYFANNVDNGDALCATLLAYGKLTYLLSVKRLTDAACESFPEFELFKPIPIHGLWFGSDDDERITCMLLCYYMCKD